MTRSPKSEVGYKRPPRHTQFQPGESSGNPKGRPKGTRNLITDLREELAEKIPIREGERHLRVSKQRAILKALVAKALKADTRAMTVVLQLMQQIATPQEAEAEPSDDTLSDEDRTILERFIAQRLIRREG